MISIIDYDAGNIKSVEKAVQYLGKKAEMTRDPKKIMESSHVILPGVGSFGDCMKKLHFYGLDNVIEKYVCTGKPFLGICLGLQLLFEESEETPGIAGLGLLKGKILHIPDDDGKRKVPHIGWNNISIKRGSRLFDGVSNNSYVYFVHSYYLKAENHDDVTATAEYGVQIDASVQHENIYATQFHPEKSSDTGLKILNNFISLNEEKIK